MPPDRVELLAQSIVTLRRLADSFLSDVNMSRDNVPSTIRRTSKELLLSISVLLPKLEAARELAAAGEHFNSPIAHRPRCDKCDDS